MKKLFIAALILLSCPTFAQDTINQKSQSDASKKVIAYVDGKRISSISETYAKLHFNGRWVFEYGQPKKRFKRNSLKDGNNKHLKIRSDIEALNILYHNGWEVVEKYYDENEKQQYWLLTKRKA